ncbi:MAG: 1-(5-phosphoribosyl)-5-((5-phosphoribosylamino)methylideneamino)imidazole-4-carboxamide isomerase [Sulfolobales archaeon]|nr:1-(5-phosphoribosyl)-5-((5-phosphoribosylamino)methylideneamino)imidazole-4-carboxamide isomerase [Sulfolobales archaeon]MDW7969947.1 1-(5-phosphoribosyl)-5-((5-phosphoribosylamino)methylideneamino)imidazole-4-carboxamide isomerase [Sulfolobales archaeon]
MKVIPSLDLSGGKAVKRVKGVRNSGIVLGDAYATAEKLHNLGYDSLHVVDLDAAEGIGSNEDVIKEVANLGFKWVQVGGGIRDIEKAERILTYGASSIVISSMFYEDPQLFDKLLEFVGGDKVLIAVDYDEDLTLRLRGWMKKGINVHQALTAISSYDVLGVIFTYVAAEGTGKGVDRGVGKLLHMVRGLKEYAGGISTMDDLTFLKNLGFDYVILGMALYSGSLLGVKYV